MGPDTLAGWPRNRWELSAAQSYALLYGPERWKPAQRVAVLARGDATTDSPVLQEVVDLYSEADGASYGDGVAGVEERSLTVRASRRCGAPAEEPLGEEPSGDDAPGAGDPGWDPGDPDLGAMGDLGGAFDTVDSGVDAGGGGDGGGN